VICQRGAFIAVALCLSGCALGPEPRTTSTREPQWQDAIDSRPELMIIVRPLALRHDPGVGPFLERIVEVGRQQSRVVADTRALEAMEDAEEVIVALRTSGLDDDTQVNDEIVVVRGVRADVDPSRLVDADGQSLWTGGPSGPLREFVRANDEAGAPADVSLFELPARTWVIAAGPGRARARRALAHPQGQPSPTVSPDALAIVHIDGPALVSRVPALRDSGELARIGRHLMHVELALLSSPGRSMGITLSYADVPATDDAESAVRKVVSVVSGATPPPTGWVSALVSARVERRSDKSVTIEFTWPAALARDAVRKGIEAARGRLTDSVDAGKAPAGDGPSL